MLSGPRWAICDSMPASSGPRAGVAAPRLKNSPTIPHINAFPKEDAPAYLAAQRAATAVSWPWLRPIRKPFVGSRPNRVLQGVRNDAEDHDRNTRRQPRSASASTGIGLQVQKPLATVVGGGSLLAPLLILLVLPVLIGVFSRRRQLVEEPEPRPAPAK